MPPAAPPFPAFDDWQKMSESEQDALLDRLEAAKRRGALVNRIMIGLAGATVVAVGGFALLTLW